MSEEVSDEGLTSYAKLAVLMEDYEDGETQQNGVAQHDVDDEELDDDDGVPNTDRMLTEISDGEIEPVWGYARYKVTQGRKEIIKEIKVNAVSLSDVNDMMTRYGEGLANASEKVLGYKAGENYCFAVFMVLLAQPDETPIIHRGEKVWGPGVRKPKHIRAALAIMKKFQFSQLDSITGDIAKLTRIDGTTFFGVAS